MQMQSQLTPEKLKAHLGHRLVIVGYSDKQVDPYGDNPQDISLECEDCFEVLADCEVV